MQPLSSYKLSTSSSTSRSSKENIIQELQSCSLYHSQKLTIQQPGEAKIPAYNSPPEVLHPTQVRETVLTDRETPLPSQVEIHIHRATSPKPIANPSPLHKSFSLSMSKRPRLSTPHSFSKGGISTGVTPASATPVTHVRSSQQWYDHIRLILRPLANYRYSSRSIEEASGHYVNDGLGPRTVQKTKDSAS